jgi:hypothetical protein
MTDRSQRETRPVSRPFTLISAIALLCVASLVALQGCGGADDTTGEEKEKAETRQENCDNLLANAMSMLKPDRLGIDSDLGAAVTLLNTWQATCAPQAVDPSKEKSITRKQFIGTLTDDEIDILLRREFDGRDGEHMRTCALLASASEAVVRSGGEDDLDRIMRLFNYVIRNVALVETNNDAIAMTPHHILLFGSGTAEDRAWVFAELLRQRHLDAVILTPGKSPPGKSPPGWLVGVLLEERVFLFDARIGLPIPPPDDNEANLLVNRPATLMELRADGEFLERLDIPEGPKYSLRDADFDDVQVAVIGSDRFWSPRMQGVQASLAGARTMVVFDGLEDNVQTTGLRTRVASVVGKWSDESVGVWPYPASRYRQVDDLSPDVAKQIITRLAAFDAPMIDLGTRGRKLESESMDDPIIRRLLRLQQAQAPEAQPADEPTGKDDSSPVVFVRARVQLRGRMAELLGDYPTAVSKYQQVRLKRDQFPPKMKVTEPMRTMHDQAAEDALYWGGVCHFEQGEFASAAASCRDYLRRHPQGTHVSVCRRVLVQSLLAGGRTKSAIVELQKVASDDSQRHGDRWLVARWQKAIESAPLKKSPDDN